MNILLGGAHGFLGGALVDHLESVGHRITRLTRGDPAGNPGDIPWNPADGELTLAPDQQFDAVIHLGGANIAEGRWTQRRKQLLRDSRIQSTGLLARALAAHPRPPKVFACASAIGIYGDRGDELLTEESSLADDFLGRLAQAWEDACEPASAAGIRVVHLRFGVILGAGGGAMAKLVLPFRLGLGGRIGDGRQFMSWISRRDAVRATTFCLQKEELTGPVNIVAPDAVTNRAFTRELGRSLHRPTLLPIPATALRLLFGEMADATLLASTRVRPAKLLTAGFEHRDSDLSSVFADF